ncbi:hypothetical protein [Paraflavitalea speifideaquila]|uniref:hypothetical protein n=1 Tax=Paraflavitalea speifideaquila TaxID=3076558 RepID=UPI0028E380F5|nr:hypothetical protein [Paraflavitalea speifideiaquila]
MEPQMLQLVVYIATPWWQTWWFYTLSFLLIAGFIYWLYRFRIRQVRKKEQLKSQYEKNWPMWK